MKPTTNSWVNVDSRAASFNSDSVATINITNQNRFINPATRAMRAQVRYRQTGSTPFYGWKAKIDQVQWNIAP